MVVAFAPVLAGPVQAEPPNGCSGPSSNTYGSADFEPACNAHDICYESSADRLVCDERLLADLRQACDKAYAAGLPSLGAPGGGAFSPNRSSCYAMADNYYAAVRAGGKSHYAGTGNPS